MATKIAPCGLRFQVLKICNRNLKVTTRNCLRFSTNSSNELRNEDKRDTDTEYIEKIKHLYPLKTVVKNYMDRTDPVYDYGSIYEYYPNAKRALIGKKPEKRIVWKEQDCTTSFPESPEKANLDLLQYIEQRDMWQRRQVISVPEFCVGSIVAVTRADQYAPDGWTRFVGLCIHKNFSINNKGENFILRNVILDEPLEIQYPIHSPLIQKIEVLRHQRWENEMPYIGLRFLRDYPKEYSTVNMAMEPEEYIETPSVRPWTDEDKQKLVEWLEMVYESKRRR